MAESAEDTITTAEVTKEEERNGEAQNGADAVNEAAEATNGESKVDEATKSGETSEANGEVSSGTAAAAEEAQQTHDNDKVAATDDTEKSKDDNEDDERPAPVSAHEREERNNRRGRGGHNNLRGSNKRKARFDDQPESSDADEIRRQVEFYFSDSNLPIDAYLLEATGGHKNKPVPLKMIHSFKRMKHFQPYTAVRDAVNESAFLNLNEDDEITRKKPLDDRFTDDAFKNRSLVHSSSMARSIYAKGFGEETDSTHLDIEAFFAPYGPTLSVRLRRKEDGEFKGSVFVEFEDEETQGRFLDLDPKPLWKDEHVLDIKSKQEYVDMKHQGIIDGDVKPRSPTRSRGFGGRGRGRGRDDGEPRSRREYHDKDDWNGRRDFDNKHDRRDGGRGGRGSGRGRGGRGGRGGGGDNRRRRSSPDYGPKVRDRQHDAETDRKDNGDSTDASKADSGPTKKRAREDAGGDAEAGASEAKKVKEEAAPVSAEA